MKRHFVFVIFFYVCDNCNICYCLICSQAQVCDYFHMLADIVTKNIGTESGNILMTNTGMIFRIIADNHANRQRCLAADAVTFRYYIYQYSSFVNISTTKMKIYLEITFFFVQENCKGNIWLSDGERWTTKGTRRSESTATHCCSGYWIYILRFSDTPR